MPSKKRLLLALTVCLTLMSCSKSPPPSSVQLLQPQTVLPATLAVPCPAPVLPEDNSMDAILLAIKKVYDQYGLCSGRLVEVIQCAQGGSCGTSRLEF